MIGSRRELSNPFVWAGLAVLLIGVVALTAVALATMRGGEPTSDGQTGVTGPTLVGASALRESPSDEATETAALAGGTSVVPIGRSTDGAWLLVEVQGREGTSGWLRSDGLTGAVDAAALPVVDGTTEVAGPPARATPSAAAPTASPDIANLVVQVVTSRDNQLAVILGNEGNAEIDVPATVLVEGGGRHPVDFESQPLRPGGRFEVVLEGEYVQRRAQVAVTVSAPGLEEESLDDNELVVTVSPDAPNDIEMLEVRVDPYLLVTVRNNSIIPLVGAVTIAVRETHPSNLLVTRVEEPLDLAAGESQVYEFEELRGVDLRRTQVILITEALNDAVRENDVFPR